MTRSAYSVKARAAAWLIRNIPRILSRRRREREGDEREEGTRREGDGVPQTAWETPEGESGWVQTLANKNKITERGRTGAQAPSTARNHDGDGVRASLA